MCGEELKKDWNICPICGTSLKNNEEKINSDNILKPVYTIQRPIYKPEIIKTKNTNSIGIIGIIIGLLGLIPFFTSLIFGIIAMIIGGIGQSRDDSEYPSKAAIYLGFLDLFIFFIFLILYSSFGYYGYYGYY